MQTDRWMCSRNCPCETIDESEKTVWTDILEEVLERTYNRDLLFVFGPLPFSEFFVQTY